MLLIQVLLIQVSTIIIFDNLYVQNQSTTTAQALARTKTRMTTWLNSNFRGRWKEVSGPNVTLASNQWMIVMRIGKQGGNYDYQAGIDVFASEVNVAREIPSLFLTSITRTRGRNSWGSSRVAAIVSLGGIYYAAHYVCPGIGRMAVNDELAAFHNHTNFGKNTQRAFLFAGSSYESVIEELKNQDEKRNERLIRYGEAYHCLHAPIHLLSCDETGAQQLQIMTVPDYRVKLTRLMLRSAYQPPPEDIAAWDGLYNGHPFVIGADMDLRRIDTAVRTAEQHGCLPIALAALEGQGSAVLLQRYADPGCATVYKVTENVLSELLGRAPNLYVPPRTQFLTEKGDVVDAPLIKTPGKAGGPHRK